MTRLIKIKTVNPKLKQDQIAKELGCSSCTFQRYRQEINMLSPSRIPPNIHKRTQKISKSEQNLGRPQMTSNQIKRSKLLNPTQMQTSPSTAQLIRKPNSKVVEKLRLTTNIWMKFLIKVIFEWN